MLYHLPRHPNTLDILIVRKETSTNSHRDFRVTRSRVLTALQWLMANNKYYETIVINHDLVSTLPEDDNLAHIHILTVSTETSSETEFPEHGIRRSPL